MSRVCVFLAVFLLATYMLSYGSILVNAPSPIQTLYSGLNFPVALAFAADGRVFFNEKNTGNIRVIASNGAILSQPFATVGQLPPGVVNTEEGLIGLALDPNFGTNHFLYVYWTYWNGTYKHARITRYTDVGNMGTNNATIFDFTDPNSVQPPNGPTNHNGGYIKFGPDGTLYLELGDFCSWDCNHIALAQNLTTYAGKILRMNSDGSVPSSNPFPSSLIYAYGYRNGVGMDFNSTGKLIATMAGPDCCDRIFFVNSGANLGWPICGVDSNQNCSPYTPSIFQTGATVTPTGIAYSTDPTVLYFGEDNTGNLMQLKLPASGPAQVSPISTFSGGVIAVERAPDGRIWFTSPDTIYRFTPSSASVLTTFASSGLGSVNPNCPSPNGCQETIGQSVTVTANPSTGWQFSTWSTISGISPSSCTGNSCNFNMPNNLVTLAAVFTPTVPLGQFASDVFSAGAGTAVILLPDYTYGFGSMTHTSAGKCGGVGVAAVSDTYATYNLVGASANPQSEVLDTNSVYVSQSTCGQPVSSPSKPVVVVAGWLVNEATNYYVVSSRLSQVYYDSATDCLRRRDTGASIQCNMSLPGVPTRDYFVLEAFKDSSGRTVYLVYGWRWIGTVAATDFITEMVLKNPSGFTHSWYVYRWNDAASGPSANSIPDAGDTFTQLAAGP